MAVIPFTSYRKKMSVLLREIGSDTGVDIGESSKHYTLPAELAGPGEPFVLTKGADSFVLPLM